MKQAATRGAAESAAWLELHGVDVTLRPHWFVEITLPSDSEDTRIELNIYPEEWGIVFRRGPRVSSLRVTDIPFIHGLDDYRLLDDLPPLNEIDRLIVKLELRHEIAFARTKATVKSNLVRAAAIVRAWLMSQR